jgi:PAS domain S-box-containing protein
MTEMATPPNGGETVRPYSAAELAHLRERALDAASTGVTIADARQPDMPLIFINPAFEQITGYSVAETLGKNCRFLQGRDTDPVALATIRAALRAQQECRVTLKNYRRDGSPIWIDLALAPVRDEHGQLTHYIGIQADITTRVRLARAQRLLAQAGTTLAASLDYEETLRRVVWLAVPELADWCVVDRIDSEGDVQRLTVAHADPTQADLAAQLQRFPTSPQSSATHPPARVLASGEPQMIVRPDEALLRSFAQGDEHWRAISAIQVRSIIVLPLTARGRVLGVMTFLTSAFSGREFDAEDLALATELAARCAQAIDNADLYRQAGEAIAARDRFVAIAAHELRTPVTTAKGYLQLLERQMLGETIDRGRLQLFVDRIGAGLERLEELVSDLLDVSRIQQGRLNIDPAPCDLTEIGRTVLGRYETPEERAPSPHRLILDAPEPVIGEWDRDRLDQVVTNLVSNAVKYSPEGGEVRLRIVTAAGGATIAISDQGLGIPIEEQGALFKPFARGAAVQGRISGTGLGLYIVRQIVEAHGGTIAVRSVPERGTTFTVTLPNTIPDDRRRSPAD